MKNERMRLMMMALMTIAAVTVNAQNIQAHYDFGRFIYPDEQPDRMKVTLTLEQFKADKWGSWYYFVDVDLSRKAFRSAYTEISREFKLGKESPFAAHIEYDGGLHHASGSYQQAALVGAAYNGHAADFSKTWSVQLLYKRFFKAYDYTSAYHSVQLTGVLLTKCLTLCEHISGVFQNILQPSVVSAMLSHISVSYLY